MIGEKLQFDKYKSKHTYNAYKEMIYIILILFTFDNYQFWCWKAMQMIILVKRYSYIKLLLYT